jgi:hypothetical protein
MAKDFYAAINEIMPLVSDGDASTPFIIYRKNNDAADTWLVEYPYSNDHIDDSESAKEALSLTRQNDDPLAVMFTGKDFTSGSFGSVCREVLSARLQEEYYITRASGKETDELHALTCFCVDNISDFSQVVPDFLITLDRPLKWLFDKFVMPQGIAAEPDKTLTGGLIDAVDERCAYELNPDKPLIDKLRANYADSGVGALALFNLMIFIEENSNAISDDAKDLLMTVDDPLGWLAFRLYNGGYEPEKGVNTENGVNGDEVIAAIEDVVENGQADIDGRAGLDEDVDVTGYEDGKTNDCDSPRIISSITLNGYLIGIGEDAENPKPYYVEACKDGERVFDMRTDKYGDALKAYSGQILDCVEEMRLARGGKDHVKLTADECLPGSKNADFTKQLIIVDANCLLPEYRDPTSQLVECIRGSGARPNAIGASVFGKELHSGASVVYGRHQVIGVADEAMLPQWAKIQLETRRDPSVFEFDGYHFKPYRQFRKGEVDKHLAGDSRPEKMDAQYAMRNMRFGNELGLRARNNNWSYEAFYDAAKGSTADIFECVENGKLYVPSTGALCEYDEPPRRNKTPRKQADRKPSLLNRLEDAKAEAAKQNAARTDKPVPNRKRGDAEVE